MSEVEQQLDGFAEASRIVLRIADGQELPMGLRGAMEDLDALLDAYDATLCAACAHEKRLHTDLCAGDGDCGCQGYEHGR